MPDYSVIESLKNYYKLSGSQGLAAVAYGTETVKKVDAIVGPGNNYTQMAKKLLFGEVKIDSIAGPSEIAIIADEQANPTFIAADMMSQAEHGTGFEASTTFCLSEEFAQKVKAEINRLARRYAGACFGGEGKKNAELISISLGNRMKS